MSNQSTVDIELMNLFYLGSYDGCISQCTKISNPTISNRLFEFRANIALDQWQYVYDEIEDKKSDTAFMNDTGVKAVHLFAQYMEAQRGGDEVKQKESLEQFESWLDDPSRSSNSTLQILAAVIYNDRNDLVSALRAVRNLSNLEMMHIYITTLLKMNRPDLAEKTLKKMKEMNDDATLTQLTAAMVNLSVGGPQKLKDAQYIFSELNNKYPDSVIVLNGLALCHMTIGEFEAAEQYLQSALTKRSKDSPSLVNMIVCQTHLKNERQVKRFSTQLKSVDPNHPWLVDRKEKSDEINDLISQYSL